MKKIIAFEIIIMMMVIVSMQQVEAGNYIHYLTKSRADTLYCPKTGCVMTGNLVVENLTVSGSYLNVTVVNYNVTGTLDVDGDIAADNIFGNLNASYIQDEYWINETGDTMTGDLLIDADLNVTGNVTAEWYETPERKIMNTIQGNTSFYSGKKFEWYLEDDDGADDLAMRLSRSSPASLNLLNSTLNVVAAKIQVYAGNRTSLCFTNIEGSSFNPSKLPSNKSLELVIEAGTDAIQLAPFLAGRLYLNGTFLFVANSTLPCLKIYVGDLSIAPGETEDWNISAGSTVTLTYDGGQETIVYLPELIGFTIPELFIGNDGSTFYDPDLTQLAQPSNITQAYDFLTEGTGLITGDLTVGRDTVHILERGDINATGTILAGEMIGVNVSNPGSGLVVAGDINGTEELWLHDSTTRFYRSGNAMRMDSILGLLEFGSTTTGQNSLLKIFSAGGFGGFFGTTNTEVKFQSDNSLPIQFAPNTAVSMTLTASGNVGINTTVPGRTLDVAGTINASDFLRGNVRLIDLIDLDNTSLVRADNTTDWDKNISDDYNGINFTADVYDSNMSLNELNTSGETLLATSSGNVGIGTLTPASELVVVGGTNVTGTIITNVTDTVELIIRSPVTTSPTKTYWQAYNGTHSVSESIDGLEVNFTTANVSGNFIVSSGNIGVGALTPASKLEVEGNINASGELRLLDSTTRIYENGNAARWDSKFGLLEFGSTTAAQNSLLKIFSAGGFGGFFGTTNTEVSFSSDNDLPIQFKPDQVLVIEADAVPELRVDIYGKLNVTGNAYLNNTIVFSGTEKLFKNDTSIYYDDGSAVYDLTRTANLTSYDTGWIARSDWNSESIGSSAVKNADSLLVHNLNSRISDLLIKLLGSVDGSDANSFEFGHAILHTDSARYGYTVNQTSLNSFKLITGAEGLLKIEGDGSVTPYDTEDHFYKIKVFKLG